MITVFRQEKGKIIVEKQRLRSFWRKKRRQISHKRKNEASREAVALLARIKPRNCVLSYASFADEFRTQELNEALIAEGRLVLPKVEGENLRIYHVEEPKKQLKPHAWGFLEPIPALCREANVSTISLAFVPGIAFDAASYRLGYGKGYYDRFLKKLPLSAPAFGLGFKEQYSPNLLPRYASDYPMNGLLLF